MVVADRRKVGHSRRVNKAGEVQFLECNLAGSTGLANRALELLSMIYEASNPGSLLHPCKGMLGC
jgi:hypothetical protein